MHTLPTQCTMDAAVTECVLPYLPGYLVKGTLASVSKDMRAVALTHTNSRYHLSKDRLEYQLLQRRWLEELPSLVSVCNGPVATQHLAKALCHLYDVASNFIFFNTPHVDDALVRSASVRDALVHMAEHATTPESVSATADAILHVADDNHLMFRTPAARDAIVSMAAYATTDVAVHDVTTAIFSVIRIDKAAAELFGVPSVRDAFVHMAEHLTTAESVRRTAAAMLLVAQGSKEIFQTPIARDAIVSMAAHATTEVAVDAVGSLITCITRDGANVFGVPSVRDALVHMTERTKPEVACKKLLARLFK